MFHQEYSTTLLVILCLVSIYAIAVVFAPFPYWRSYLTLAGAVLRLHGKWSAKRRQIVFLLKALAWAPLWTLLWYLDELLYPAYRQREIKPVFIIGQPRCGTTFLHRTLAVDDHTFFAVRHIEWRYPFICLQKLITFLGLEKSLGRFNYWPGSKAGELAAKMHPNTLADWEEDGIFFEEKFLHHFFIFLRFPYPQLLPYLDSFSELPENTQRRMLNVYLKVLKKVNYLRGSEPHLYLSKEVTSHKRIPALLRLFPSARFIVMVRPARHFMSSLSALMRMSTMSKTNADPGENPLWQEAFMRRMQEDSLRLVNLCRNEIPLERQVRVSSNDFTRNPGVTVPHIYQELGLPMREAYAEHISHLKQHQRVRQRGYEYPELVLQGFDEYDAFVAEVEKAYMAHASGGLHPGSDHHDQEGTLPECTTPVPVKA